MPRTLKDDIADDTRKAIISTSGVAETLVYRPAGGGAPRSITGTVRRQPPEPIDGVPQSTTRMVHVLVPNSSTYGISSAELNTGGDRIDVAVLYGETAETLQIKKLLGHNCGSCLLEVR